MERNETKDPILYKITKQPWLKWIVLIIPLAYVVAVMVVPLLNILKRSVMDESGFTLEYLILVLTKPLYLKVLWITIRTGLIVTVVTILLAYPMAYLSVNAKRKGMRRLITGGVLIPYWVSMLVRIFAWQIILSKNGVLNGLLMALHIIDEPLTILYTSTAVVISLTHVLLPYMFLSMQAVMEGIDPNLKLAAEGMGAKAVTNFLTIFLPLSVPGIISGSSMVFVLALGFYIAPALLGGSGDMMMSNLIQENMNNMNWNLSAALSVVLMFVVLVFFGVAYHFVGDKLFNRKA